MKFDTIIIGGGLSGLVCGIRLQNAGKKCAIISSGQSAMHFSSGYFALLDRTPDGKETAHPFQEVESLPSGHPYSKIGKERLMDYASQVKDFFGKCGVVLHGNPLENGFRITPTGNIKPTWLAMEDFEILESGDSFPWKKVLVANIEGYLDFNASFISASLEEKGTDCSSMILKLTEMERLRSNPSEMRSTNIARVAEKEEVLKKVASHIKASLKDEDAVILPAVFGFSSASVKEALEKEIGRKVVMIATMPPSVPGIRTQKKLKAAFENAGGLFLSGDTVCAPEFDGGGKVTSIGTVNFGDVRLSAENYVLASGSFFSKGLSATPDKIEETVFGLDTDYLSERSLWYDTGFFNPQAYISFGVMTDNDFRCFRNGEKTPNLFATGSILGGCNALYEGSGAGTAIFSSFKVADTILSEM